MSVRAVAATTGAIVILLLAAAAVLADLRAPGLSPWLATADVAVGLAFGGVALVAHGLITEGVVFAAVGGAWLAGSVLPAARTWHQAVLGFALLAFPSGRPSRVAHWPVLAFAVVVGLGALPQLGGAVLFVTVAVLMHLPRRRDARTAVWYPAAAAIAVAVVLAASWVVARRDNGIYDPVLALLAYEVVLADHRRATAP